MNPITLSSMEPVYTGEEAALYDLGDGIACLQFRSKGNSISPAVRAFIVEVLDTQMDAYKGLVIGNQDKNFSVGANLASMRDAILAKETDDAFTGKIQAFQEMTQKIKRFHKPIVAAPHGMTLGGGLEVALHCHKRVALTKVYMGLVEVGVGLLPGGGGLKETALSVGKCPEGEREDALVAGFKKILMRRVSKDAQDAVKLGYLRADDVIVEDDAQLLSEAKRSCLQLVSEGFVRREEETVALQGKAGYEKLMETAQGLLSQERISPYDLEIGKVIAGVLTCSTPETCRLTETALLAIERKGFLTLIRNAHTFERIQHFLDTGKLLSN